MRPISGSATSRRRPRSSGQMVARSSYDAPHFSHTFTGQDVDENGLADNAAGFGMTCAGWKVSYRDTQILAPPSGARPPFQEIARRTSGPRGARYHGRTARIAAGRRELVCVAVHTPGRARSGQPSP